MRKTLAALTTAGVLAGSLLLGSPAEAAGTCPGSAGAAGKPAALTNHRFALWNTKNKGYTGTPFSFQVVLQYGGFPDKAQLKTYTYDNNRRGYRHSMTTGSLRTGAVVRVRTWCGGKRGADWVGWVRTR